MSDPVCTTMRYPGVENQKIPPSEPVHKEKRKIGIPSAVEQESLLRHPWIVVERKAEPYILYIPKRLGKDVSTNPMQ
jgi:hypothetical protein